jgi:uncharacterized protein YbjT (DUF2867 family)
MKKIAVLGATGMLGKPVTDELIRAGFEVTILARNIKKAKELFPQANIVFADLASRTTLSLALKGQEAVYLNLHIPQHAKPKDFMPETTGLLNLIEAAKENNIQRITYLSSLVKDYQGQNNFNCWVFDVKQKAVQILKSSKIPYTIFYPSSFMENFDKGGFMNGNQMNLAGKAEAKMYWISGADYGKQVAKSFEVLTDENREYNVQGPEAYYPEEAVRIFIDNYKIKRLSVFKTPMGVLKFMGKFSNKINYIYHILEALNKYEEKFKSQFTWDELGQPKETIKDYTIRIQK